MNLVAGVEQTRRCDASAGTRTDNCNPPIQDVVSDPWLATDSA